MAWEWFLLFICVGAVAGLLAGLLGIGGGMILVPCLYFSLLDMDLPQERLMQVAIGTSLASTAITTFASSWSHHRRKAINYKILRLILPGTSLGCIAGAVIARDLPGGLLKMIFSVMIILLGSYYLLPRVPDFHIHTSPNRSLNVFGFVIGNLSSLLGIGGGIFTVPVLLGYQVPLRSAVALSSASTLATVWIGSITYLYIAWHLPEYPYIFGYVHVPAFCAIAIGSLSLTSVGSALSQKLNTLLLKRIFGAVLLLTGLSFVIF